MANRNVTKWSPRVAQNAGAGATAGGVVSLCLHPVDTLKTLVQARAGGNRNLLPIMSALISERGLGGLYRGLGSNLIASTPISAIYTHTYETVKAGLLRHIPEDMSALAHCVAGGCACVATSFVYTPSDCETADASARIVYK
ncbi:S-adenosylmethionine carrier 1, chloroplastic/mitochondrial-like isoform X2 [Physcomitrium patens]|uniref:Mitochondrial carrier protein n=1 Tax=Physcomitrium patens TaxID=3218 RepID=A0A7I4BEP7_PHYPA